MARFRGSGSVWDLSAIDKSAREKNFKFFETGAFFGAETHESALANGNRRIRSRSKSRNGVGSEGSDAVGADPVAGELMRGSAGA